MPAVCEHIIAEDVAVGFEGAVCIKESTRFGVIISRLEIVIPRLNVVVITPVSERVQLGVISICRGHARIVAVNRIVWISPCVVGIRDNAVAILHICNSCACFKRPFQPCSDYRKAIKCLSARSLPIPPY